jgi:hypothetical protein
VDHPESALDVPEITGKADHPGPAIENGLDEGMIATGVRQARREHVDIIEGIHPLAVTEQLEVSGGKGNIPADGLRAQRGDGKLHKDNAPVRQAHGSYSTKFSWSLLTCAS